MWKTADVTAAKKNCAFCRYWYDPTNSAIRPKSGVYWEYDTDAKRRCMKKVKAEMQSWASCGDYVCKV